MYQAKILRHHDHSKSLNDLHKIKPCLAELSFGISLNSVLIASGPIVLEKMDLTMNQTKTIIHDGLYDYIRDVKSLNTSDKSNKKSKKSNKNETPLIIDEIFQRILPVIPKVNI